MFSLRRLILLLARTDSRSGREDGVMDTLAGAGAGAVATTNGVGGGQAALLRKQGSFASAAAYVEGGVQDACEDSCSICLEPFCHSDPATVTCCRHEYHLQCILEWAQRSKDCPMCWQPLSLEDVASQELLDAVGHEQPWRNAEEVPALPDYAELEDQIMQHLVHQMARRAFLHNRQTSSPDNQGQPVGSTVLLPPLEFLQQQTEPTTASDDGHSNTPIQSHGAPRSQQERWQRASNISVVTESLKSRLLSASSNCKQTLSRTTHSFKERWRGRNTKTRDSGVGGGAEGRAVRRVSPEAEAAAAGQDVPTTSNSRMS